MSLDFLHQVPRLRAVVETSPAPPNAIKRAMLALVKAAAPDGEVAARGR
jgi:hypothetical protein